MLSGVFVVGTLGCVLAPSWEVLAVFRFILGLAVGGASATVPVYLSEIAPFVGLGVLAVIFIVTQVPETRGQSLEDLEARFRREYS